MITETEQVSQALAVAEKEWPLLQDRPAQLLTKLLAEGAGTLKSRQNDLAAQRKAAVLSTAGSMTDIYRPNELELLRADWNE
ncbi:MAG: hypothetical protein ACRC0L_11115 [Angustibacter sp.]